LVLKKIAKALQKRKSGVGLLLTLPPLWLMDLLFQTAAKQRTNHIVLGG